MRARTDHCTQALSFMGGLLGTNFLPDALCSASGCRPPHCPPQPTGASDRCLPHQRLHGNGTPLGAGRSFPARSAGSTGGVGGGGGTVLLRVVVVVEVETAGCGLETSVSVCSWLPASWLPPNSLHGKTKCPDGAISHWKQSVPGGMAVAMSWSPGPMK